MAYQSCGSITLAGIATDCTPSIGGIKVVYLLSYDNLGEVKVTDNQVSDIELLNNGKWYRYQFRKNTSSLTSTWNAGATEGDYFIQNDLAMVFNRMDTAKRIEISALTAGHTAAVVEDMNGNVWFLGMDQYLSASAGTGVTGTAAADANAYNITLTTQSADYPFALTAEAYEAVKTSANAA